MNITGVYLSSSAFGDYDNDGDLDLLLTGYTDNGIIAKLYKNTGGTYSEDTDIDLTGVMNSSSEFGDYDNDGDLDILITGDSGSAKIAKIYRNTGSNFSEDTGNNLTGVHRSTSAFGDYDNDGDLDIIIAGNTGTASTTKIYRNTAGNFSEITEINLPSVDMGSLSFGDYDNDGDLDILITGTGGGYIAKIYKNEENNFIEDTNINLTGVYKSSSQFADYDNDGDLDILITGYTSEVTAFAQIYRNNIDISNLPPSEPISLTTVVTGQNVLLSWSAGSDTETISAAGLNYNLRIGSTSGASDILAPMTLPLSSGYRLIPERGMVQNLTATVNLPDGKYYWSVQAIDTAFAGSEFATEASFAIGSPEISTISNHSISEDTSIDAISFMITDTNATPCSLTITFESSNTVLIPTENISYTCNSGYYTLTVNPAVNQSGTSILTVMAMNPYGNTATSSFSLTVTEVNDMPQISNIFDQSIGSANNVSITFTASDIESADCALAITITSSNQTLIPDANLSYSCNANNYTLTAIKELNSFGYASITVVVGDGTATSVEQFTITTIPTIGFNSIVYTSTESAGIISITTTLSHAIDETISADFTVVGGTASSGNDFTPNNGTLIILAGSISKVFTISVIDDSNYEPEENLMLSLSNFMNVTRTTGTGSSYTLTILDNDSPPTISWSPASASVSENSGSIQLTASLSMISGLPASIEYTVSGTATNGMDYTLADGTLSIPAGSTSENITIVIGNDIIDENPETVIVPMYQQAE